MKQTVFYAFTVLFFLSALQAQSQEIEQSRIEIEVDNDWNDINSIPCGEKGVMNFYRYYDGNRDKDQWVFTFFNNELEEEWTGKNEVKEDLGAIDQYYDKSEQVLYVILSYYTPVNVVQKIIKNDEDVPVEILKIDLKARDIKIEAIKYKVDILEDINYKSMYVENGMLFILGDPATAKMNPCGMLFPGNDKEEQIYVGHGFAIDGNKKDVPLQFKNRGAKYFVLNSVVSESGNISILVSEDDKKENDLIKVLLYTLDTKEAKILPNPLHVNKGVMQMVSQGAIMNYEKDKQVFMLITGKKKGEVYVTTGIIENGEVVNLQRNSSAKVLNKSFHQKNIMPYGIGLSNRLVMSFHPKAYKINDDGDFMIVGERTSPYFVHEYSSNGYSQRLAGWTYHEAYLMKFSSEGNFLETDEFDMKDVLFPELVPFPHLTIFPKVDNDDRNFNYWIVFSHGGDIISSSMDRERLDSRQQVQEIGTGYGRKKKVKNTAGSRTDLWYGNCFLAYGFAAVKEKGLLKFADSIYYFNKIEFDPRRRR